MKLRKKLASISILIIALSATLAVVYASASHDIASNAQCIESAHKCSLETAASDSAMASPTDASVDSVNTSSSAYPRKMKRLTNP